MDRNRRLSARLCLLLLGLASQAEAREPQPCASRLLDAVARQVGHDGWIAPSYESSGPFLAVACKPWPDDPAQTVIAMAYLDPGDTAVEGERHPHLLLAKADSRSGKLSNATTATSKKTHPSPSAATASGWTPRATA